MAPFPLLPPPSPDTDAYRIWDGPEAGIDCYAGHWVIQTKGGSFPWDRAQIGAWGAKSLWWKRLDQHLKEAPAWLSGERVDQPFPVQEHGVRFEIDLRAGYSQGIFLDQRLNRLAVRQRVRAGDRVLNAFAYTCGFSVAAALGGAVATSLDLSAPYLEWGKRNFAANGLDSANHYFTRGDVRDWLGRWRKSGVRFAGIILDPPTFSRGGSRGVFRVETDFAALVEEARPLLEPGGWMLCCTNFRGMGWNDFAAAVQRGLRGDGRLERRDMPPEYAAERYLKSLWVELA